jgi:hypothetical protein
MDTAALARRLHGDPLYFMEACLKIQPLEGGLIQFVLNHHQMRFIQEVWEQWKAQEPVRFIVLKARRRGFSTVIDALAYWLTSTREHRNALIVAQDLDASHNILQMAHRFSTNDGRRGWDLMPDQSRSNRAEIVWDTQDWRERGVKPGLDSRILVASADKKAAGRSFTLHFLHGTEVAHWGDATLVTGLVDALSNTPESMGFLESTANGRSGYFYDTWKQAERGKGMWKPFFASWKGDPDCRLRMSGQMIKKFRDAMTQEEWTLEKEHGLDVRELAWRRRKIETYEGSGRNPEDVFRQEWPLTPDEAFVGTGRQYFHLGVVSQMEERAKAAKWEEGWLELVHPIVKNRPAGVRFHPRKPLDGRVSHLRVWDHPKPGADYVIGADVAMGRHDGDDSVAYVLRRDTQQFVARLAGKIEPDLFADLIVELGWYYNEAFICPENNSIGMATAKRSSAKYSRHAYEVDVSSPGNPKYKLDRPGWHTHEKNRREMLAYLRQQLRDGNLGVWCEDFLAECYDFIVPETLQGKSQENHPRAAEHKHDDHIMAAAIALQANDPMLAGPIRRMKGFAPLDENWRQAALRTDVESEVAKPGAIYDDTVGSV